MVSEGERRLKEYLSRPSGYDALLGTRFIEATRDVVRAELVVRDSHLQIHGFVHGGVLCSLIETACSVGASLALPSGFVAVGLENHTSFVGAAQHGEVLRIEAHPLHHGRRSQFWEAKITASTERLIARGQVRLLCIDSAQSPSTSSEESSPS